MIDASEESDTLLTGMVLGDKVFPDYYWERDHDIPLFWVDKHKESIDKRKEFVEYFLRISFRKHARKQKRYIEWPRLVYMSVPHLHRVIVEHKHPVYWEYKGFNNDDGKSLYELSSNDDPEKEYVIVETDTGKAKYKRAFPHKPNKQLLWKLVKYEGTVK